MSDEKDLLERFLQESMTRTDDEAEFKSKMVKELEKLLEIAKSGHLNSCVIISTVDRKMGIGCGIGAVMATASEIGHLMVHALEVFRHLAINNPELSGTLEMEMHGDGGGEPTLKH